MSKIEVRNIYKIFGAQPKKWMDAVKGGMSKEELLSRSGHTLGLRDISLSIEEGSIFVVMGLSGSGKSTLIRHFNRLIEPSGGQILVAAGPGDLPSAQDEHGIPALRPVPASHGAGERGLRAGCAGRGARGA